MYIFRKEVFEFLNNRFGCKAMDIYVFLWREKLVFDLIINFVKTGFRNNINIT